MLFRAPSYNKLCWVLIVMGLMLRACLWALNPPDNTYDFHHHKKVIRIYAEEKARPAPDRCWQCYQPPLFYMISASIFELSNNLPLLKNEPWKITQGLNLLLSGLNLMLLLYLFRLLGVRLWLRLLILSLAVILPRDLYTAAMMSNDYLLIFFTTASACLFVRCIKQLRVSGSLSPPTFLMLGVTVILGALTKQHGLLLLVFPLYLSFLMLKSYSLKKAFYVIGALVIIIGLSGSSELWLYNQTGTFLVSNQAFFDHHSEGQKPGALNKVEFTSFRLSALFEDPFQTATTKRSLPTNLFARLWYDHENRFMVRDTNFSMTAGRIAYGFGLIWTIAAICIVGYYGFYHARRKVLSAFKLRQSALFPLVVISTLFLLVPVVQTLRLPYFSSMKALFYLPAIPVMLALLGYACQSILPDISKKLVLSIVSLNVLFGILMIIPAVYHFC